MPPHGVRAAMEMQAEAERKKRAQILESEGKQCLLRLVCYYSWLKATFRSFWVSLLHLENKRPA